MERKRHTWGRGIAVLIAVVAVGTMVPALPAAIFYDSFDRTDTTDMSPAWFEQHGDWSVVGGTARSAAGDSGASCSLMTVDGFADPNPLVQVTVDYDGQPRATYVALVLLYLDTETNAFIKVQDGYEGSPPDGLFDTVYFYKGNNGGREADGDRFRPLVADEPAWNDLAPYFSTATLSAWVEGDAVYLAVDRDFDGHPDPVDTDLDGEPDACCYWRDGVAVEEFGDGVGLGGYNAAWCDDFTILPGPATLALLGLGAAALVARRRRG